MNGIEGIKYVTYERCVLKHEQVEKLEERVETLAKTFNGKLDKIMVLLLTLLLMVIASLVGGIITVLVWYHTRV